MEWKGGMIIEFKGCCDFAIVSTGIMGCWAVNR